MPDGGKRPLNSKGAFVVPANGRVVMEAPGSGGYGLPAGRDPASLREDLADGYVTEEAARRDYGIAD
jgi:N-methylhydantoinase B